MGLFSSGNATKQALQRLDSGETIAVQLNIGGAGSKYMVIRIDKLQELATAAGYELVLS